MACTVFYTAASAQAILGKDWRRLVAESEQIKGLVGVQTIFRGKVTSDTLSEAHSSLSMCTAPALS